MDPHRGWSYSEEPTADQANPWPCFCLKIRDAFPNMLESNCFCLKLQISLLKALGAPKTKNFDTLKGAEIHVSGSRRPGKLPDKGKSPKVDRGGSKALPRVLHHPKPSVTPLRTSARGLLVAGSKSPFAPSPSHFWRLPLRAISQVCGFPIHGHKVP